MDEKFGIKKKLANATKFFRFKCRIQSFRLEEKVCLRIMGRKGWKKLKNSRNSRFSDILSEKYDDVKKEQNNTDYLCDSNEQRGVENTFGFSFCAS